MSARDRFSTDTRWQIATKGLTGAYAMIAKAYKDALGEEKYNEFNGPFWKMAGAGGKQLAENLGTRCETAKDLAEVFLAGVVSSMGPEFEGEIVEASDDKAVVRYTKCPWFERAKEVNMGFDYCKSGHENWGDGVCEALNPEFTTKLTRTMMEGDLYCENIIMRKR